MPIKMEAMPELPEIKSEIKAEDFISSSVNTTTPVGQTADHSPHHQPQQAGTPNNLVDHQLQSATACGWVGCLFFCFICDSV